MLELIEFIHSSFWVWLGFNITINIPLLCLMGCISNVIIQKSEAKEAYKYMIECKKLECKKEDKEI